MVVALAAFSYACSDGAAGPCNTLVNDGPKVTTVWSTDPAPEPAGGEIADGTYEFSGSTYYGPTQVPVLATGAVMEFSGGTVQTVRDNSFGEHHYSGTFSTFGALITFVDTCPTPDRSTTEFTATPTEFHFYHHISVGTFEDTYTKR